MNWSNNNERNQTKILRDTQEIVKYFWAIIIMLYFKNIFDHIIIKCVITRIYYEICFYMILY